MSRRPTVLFINRVYPPSRGATGRVLRDLARSFCRDGWDVTILTSGPNDRLEKDGPIRVMRVRSRMKGKSMTGYISVLVRLMLAGLKLPAHDLVVTMTDPPMLVLAGQVVARAKKSRHINWCQDLYPDLFPTVGLNLPDFLLNPLQRMTRRAMQKCDRVVTVGRCMARQLSHSGIDARKIAVIPNWPDFELLDLSPANDLRIRDIGLRRRFKGVNGSERRKKRRKGADEAAARPFQDLFRDDGPPKFRILYSGTLGRAHPIATVLDAAEILNRQKSDVEFVFVGDGPGQEKLAQERARRGLENIRLLPWQPASRLKELMESGDVHLISMNHDAAGLIVPSKLYSALAVQRPCIFVGPVSSETAKIIQDFKAGTVVAQGESEILAQAILSFRNSGDVWFAAHDGAARAGRIFVPAESITAWIKRARDTVGIPVAMDKAS